jgi:hypothetical protein
MGLVKLTLAYKFIATMLMVQEANFFCQQTGLPPGRPFAESDLRQGGHVGPYNPKDFIGSIVTDDYMFGFGWGHLAIFRKRGFMPDGPASAIRERNLELSTFSSLIDTNGAHQLATNWLTKLGVNVPALEGKYRLNFIQWRYYPQGKEGRVIMLPVYTVEWLGFILKTQPDRERAVVKTTVFGATKELVDLQVLDDSLFLRPPIAIPKAEKLLSMPDEDFREFDSLQRSNLAARFTTLTESERAALFRDVLRTNRTAGAGLQKTVPSPPGRQGQLDSARSEVHKLAPAVSEPKNGRTP